jgi:hypothetical protein
LIPHVEPILDIQSYRFKYPVTFQAQKKQVSRLENEKLSFADILKEKMNSMKQPFLKKS